MPHHSNIFAKTTDNAFFRQVVFTGQASQLVVMSVPPDGEIGEEVHEHVEQTLFFLSGRGKALLNGQPSEVNPGDVVVVTPGTRHNFINTGTEDWKIFTVYAPPNHIDGRVHKTKDEADKDIEDEEFGHRVGL